MVRIPSFTRPSRTESEDSRPVSPSDTATTGRPATATAGSSRTATTGRSRLATIGRSRAGRERTEPVVTGPRPRSSGLATISLMSGVLAVAAVATGALAAPGIVLGAVALLFGVGGVSATARRHVAGRSEALLAVVLGLAAVVFGAMALAGTLAWLTDDTNQVSRLHDWLYEQAPWLAGR